MTKSFRSLISVLLLLALLCASLPVLAAAEPGEYTHTAVASVGLKIRKTGTKNSSVVGQIAKGATVYITEYGSEWCKVIKGSTAGYVLTKYLDAITPVAGYSEPEAKQEEASAEAAAATAAPKAAANPEPGFTMDSSNFVRKYIAYSLGTPNVYASPSENASVRYTLTKYESVDVGQVSGDWALIVNAGGNYGYILTKKLFKWDRYDPYAGPIPNMDVYTHIAWTNKMCSVYSLKTGEVLRNIYPGAAVACWDKDEQGRYVLPIEREYGYLKEEDVAYVQPVVAWEDAQSGDLLSTMTTFFPLGVHTLQYQGRCWNLYLSTTYISGFVLLPGQHYNQNDVIGPYSGPSGYKKAPILASEGDGQGYGGGTCQVNTTFYMTTVALPLMIDQRQVHQNVGMHYCKIGLDASVGGGNITLKMHNTMPYAIRYQYYITDTVLTCAIYRY